MNQHQAAQAVSIAAAHTVDRYTVPNDVTYLVLNGIGPDEAAQRVVAHRRRMTIWGFATAGSLLWIGVLIGWGLRLIITGVGAIVLTSATNPLSVIGGAVSLAVGVSWAYLLLMWAVWSWRRAARGCPWEDSRNPWKPARRPRTGVGAPVAPAEGRAVPMAISVVGLALISPLVLVPIAGGLFGGIAEVLQML